MKDLCIYWKGKFIHPNWFQFKIWSLKNWFTKWKLVNKYKCHIITLDGMLFMLTDSQKIKSEKIYKEKGTISYEFYPCAGIGWGLRIHVLKTDEVIDITDVNNW